ncbi:hypothetical protein THRCLA_22337, partial [Thraustotheca clavata]
MNHIHTKEVQFISEINMKMTWNDMQDLYTTIMAMAGPLTQYLNGLQPTIQDIWLDVFDLD